MQTSSVLELLKKNLKREFPPYRGSYITLGALLDALSETIKEVEQSEYEEYMGDCM